MDDRDRERAKQRDDIPRDDGYIPPRNRSIPPRRRDIGRTTPPRSRYIPSYTDDDDDEYEPRPRRARRRKRSCLPAFLAGCTATIICIVLAAAAFVFYTLHLAPGNTLVHIPGLASTRAYTQSTTQQVTLTSLSLLQVCDKIGNVSVTVDPQASHATVITQKIVQATSSDEANQDFKHIMVETQPPSTIQNPLTCARFPTPSASTQTSGSTFTVNTTIPNSDGLSPSTSNRVDIDITLPVSVLSNGPIQGITVESSVGNIAVDGLTGQFNIKGSTGNITLKNAYLMPASDVETGQGNITYNGRLITPTTTTTQQSVYFKFSSEKGNINVTLPDTTNVTLDTNTNAGTIKSDFNDQVQISGEAASYQGPLNASAGTPASTLVIDVSLGNVAIHKQQPSS